MEPQEPQVVGTQGIWGELEMQVGAIKQRAWNPGWKDSIFTLQQQGFLGGFR